MRMHRQAVDAHAARPDSKMGHLRIHDQEDQPLDVPRRRAKLKHAAAKKRRQYGRKTIWGQLADEAS